MEPTTISHPEWSRVNSLTAPADREGEQFRATVSAPLLTEPQLEAAEKALINTSIVSNYPEFERQFVDPPIPGQKFGLISFVPSKGATPDKDGVYGFAKLRGHYDTDHEAIDRARSLIQSVDSYHKISVYHVGRPVPITLNSEYAATTTKVDIKNKVVSTVSEDIKVKREKEKAEIEEMKRREKQLLDEAKPDYTPDPYEEYTTLRVKKAQLIWTYNRTMEQLEKVKASIIKTRAEIARMDTENPGYSKEHVDRYMAARKAAGIPDESTTEETYMKFLVEDIDLGF